MATVAAALIPVFLIIALGAALRRTLLPVEEAWAALERLTYFVLFPALLIVTTGTADLKGIPSITVGVVLLASVLIMATTLLLLRPFLMRVFSVSGPAYSSIFQASTRWNTYVALAISGALYGAKGLALVSVAIVAIVPVLNVINVWVLAHFASTEKLDVRTTIGHMLRNPLIWSCLIGLALNLSDLPLPKIAVSFGEILGRASLALGLLVVGGGLALADALKFDSSVAIATTLKLIMMPLAAIGLGIELGLSGPPLVVVAIASSVPAAPTSYVLARQMGGDAQLLARILTVQTVLALVTITTTLALTESIRP